MSEKKETCYAFLDTNVLLHYRLFTNIDWLRELNADKVFLVFSIQVVHELDDKKFSGSNPKTRKQAKKVLSKLYGLSDGAAAQTVTSNVEALFLLKEPDIDWPQEHLDPTVGDDRFIGTILSAKFPRENVVIVTADLGLKLKAKARDMYCHILSERLQLKPKPTSAEKEVVELKKRLSSLENRLPALSIKVKTPHDITDIVKVTLEKPILSSKEDREARLKEIRSSLEYSSSGPKVNVKIPTLPNTVTQSEIVRYEKEVDDYVKGYRAYLENIEECKEIESRVVQLTFILINEGTSPADDIDILLYFPDGFELTDKKGFVPKISPPSEPKRPMTMGQMIRSPFNISDIIRPALSRISIPDIGLPTYREPTVKKINSYEVAFSVPGLKHGFTHEFDPVHLLFPSIDSARSFKVEYSISAANLPQESTGNIHIVIANKSS